VTAGFRLSEEEAWEFVSRAHKSIVTTLRADGRPVASPVWHVVIDRRLYVRTPAATPKLRRIRKDDRAHVLVEDGVAWGELRSVSFEARAVVLEVEPMVLRAIAEKYARYEAEPARLPSAARAYYADLKVVELTPVGRLHSFNNAALLRMPGAVPGGQRQAR
jgi:PPOX class probable F420-dependent enzyme